MDALKDLSFAVRQLISINEKLQSARLRGTALNKTEREIVRACAQELLGLTTGVNDTHDYAVHQSGSSGSTNVMTLTED
jgi:hypothetical protein